jgi:hypothetical protein
VQCVPEHIHPPTQAICGSISQEDDDAHVDSCQRTKDSKISNHHVETSHTPATRNSLLSKAQQPRGGAPSRVSFPNRAGSVAVSVVGEPRPIGARRLDQPGAGGAALRFLSCAFRHRCCRPLLRSTFAPPLLLYTPALSPAFRRSGCFEKTIYDRRV